MVAPVLTIKKNGQILRSVTLEPGEVVLGRGEGCIIRLDDRSVSRQHAVIKLSPSGLVIEKKSHLAPLRINGSECESAVLQQGDEVFIGPYLLKVALPEESLRGNEAGEYTPAPIQSEAAPALEGVAEPSALDVGLAASDEGVADPLDFSAPDDAEIPPGLSIFGGSAEGSSREASPIAVVEKPKSEELSSFIEEDARTRLLPQDSLVKLKLRFSPGAANIEIREFDQDEISIGRGKGCDVVLNDKKASRKHLVIRRAGVGVDTNFTIRDLESANGVYVNGARITEHLLSGDDVVRVGDTEFVVQAVLPNYDQKAAGFLRVDQGSPIHEESQLLQGMARLDEGGVPLPAQGQAAGGALVAESPVAGIPGLGDAGLSNVIGVAGLPGAGSSGKMGLLERWRAMPQRTRLIGLVAVGMVIWTILDELPQDSAKPAKSAETQLVKKSKQQNSPSSGSGANLPSFEQLKPELKKFVEAQYALALEYFRNRDYDRSLYEVRKIFQYVSDYRDSRDLERYAVEGRQRLQAQEDERRRREQEEANKARVARLVIEVEGHMARKEHVRARELFAEIISIEPDNAQVAGWKREIEAYEEAAERERMLKQFERETRARAEEILASGRQALKDERWFKAIELFQSVDRLELKDKKLLARASKGVRQAKEGIAAARDPLLEEATRLEQESNYPEAFKKFAEARRVDPGSGDAKAGMDRARKYLNDRAKLLYTEGVLAESYSDFALARTRFEQLIELAPPDDPYHERARRKLSRYILQEGTPR